MMSMEERMQDMDALVDKLATKEKRRRRNSLIYLALPVLAGVVLIFWTGWQAETITKQVKTISTQAEIVGALENSTTTLQIQLVQTRQVTEYIRSGVVKYYEGNYSDAIDLYNKAIELDSLNPVVLELKSELLLKKGQAQEAAKIIDKAVKADSIQADQFNELLQITPEAETSLKATEAWKKILKFKPDSQDVIRRKQKARELKGR
jgi:tetratricopeptide (TPR) repeat protein